MRAEAAQLRGTGAGRLPSVLLALREELYGPAVLDTLALLAVVGLYRLDQLAFRWRALGLCTIYYALSMGLLMAVGSISQISCSAFPSWRCCCSACARAWLPLR